MQITNKFQADTVVTTGQQATTAKQIADQVISDPANAGNQLTILYTLVKNLDPNSAVREGELSLAQTTQSYLNKWGTQIERIGKGQVISSEAAVDLAKATKSLADKWEQSAQRREKQYTAQAKVAGVGDAFNEYLGQFDRTYSGTGIELNQSAEEMENRLITNLNSVKTSNPILWGIVSDMMVGTNPSTGRPYSAEEILQAFPELK